MAIVSGQQTVRIGLAVLVVLAGIEDLGELLAIHALAAVCEK
jgi:hypothetical protein